MLTKISLIDLAGSFSAGKEVTYLWGVLQEHAWKLELYVLQGVDLRAPAVVADFFGPRNEHLD